MMTGNERMVLSGGAVNQRLFETALELAGCDRPRLLIDQSAAPNQARFEHNRARLGELLLDKLGVTPEWLQPDFDSRWSPSKMRDLINEADVLYVGSGNARHIRPSWGGATDRAVKQAIQQGQLVASGTSAGTLLWFEQGHGDGRQYEVPDDAVWNYVRVVGNAVIPAWATVHYNETDAFGRSRSDAFERTLRSHRFAWKTAVGLDTYAALICHDGVAEATDIRGDQTNLSQTAHIFDSNAPRTPHALRPGEQVSLGD